jgi:hypothetical protein
MRKSPILKYYTSIYVEELSGSTKNLSLDYDQRIHVWSIHRPSIKQTIDRMVRVQ